MQFTNISKMFCLFTFLFFLFLHFYFSAVQTYQIWFVWALHNIYKQYLHLKKSARLTVTIIYSNWVHQNIKQ